MNKYLIEVNRTIAGEQDALQLALFIGRHGYRTVVSGAIQRRLAAEGDSFPFDSFRKLLDHQTPPIRIGAAWILYQGKAWNDADSIKQRLSRIRADITSHTDIREMHIYEEMLNEERSPTSMMMDHIRLAWNQIRS